MAELSIKCKVCGAEFVFSEGEQEYFTANNLNTPKKCQSCRKQAKEARKIANQKIKKQGGK